MKVLGVDTVFQTVCAAVIENARVLSNVRQSTPVAAVSQSLLDLTSRHIGEIGRVLVLALREAGTSVDEIDLIAVNNAGSLLSNVLIGLVTANTLAAVRDIPIVKVSHQEGHIFSNWIERDPDGFHLPALVFSASGGHSLLALLSRDDFRYKILSEIRGVKGMSILGPRFAGIGYLFSQVLDELNMFPASERTGSDGELIARLAQQGDPERFRPRPRKPKDDLLLARNCESLMRYLTREIRREKRRDRNLPQRFVNDVAAGFQESLVEIIAGYLLNAARMYQVREIHVAGGVSANEALREELALKLAGADIVSRFPVKKEYCTDNAAMIAAVGRHKFLRDQARYTAQRFVGVSSDLVLESIAVQQALIQKKRIERR